MSPKPDYGFEAGLPLPLLHAVFHNMLDGANYEYFAQATACIAASLVTADSALVFVEESGVITCLAATSEAVSQVGLHPDPKGLIATRIKSSSALMLDGHSNQGLGDFGPHESALLVPLLVDGTPVGVLLATGSRPKQFSHRDLEMLELLADFAALTIRRSQRWPDGPELVEEWRRTIDALEDALLVVDLDGKITHVNRVANELLEDDGSAELIGRHITDLGDSEPWQVLGTLVEDIENRRLPVDCEVTDRRTGVTWNVNLRELVGTERSEQRVVVVIKDLTEVHQLIDSVQRLASLSTMGSLVAGVAHEVRNPLFAMTATLEALEFTLDGVADVADSLNVLRGSVDQLVRLTDDLLNLGRPPTLVSSSQSITVALQLAISRIQPMLRAARVHVEVQACDTLPKVECDVHRMAQVFENVITNAAQHTPPDGTVTVTCEQISESHDRWLEVRVLDEGPGFTELTKARAFEPFFSQRAGGTGLGLSIVNRIVEQHAGEVFIGNGTPAGGLLAIRLRLPSN